MGFKEDIQTLAGNLTSLVPHLCTEEATKNALVLPFIRALGYDVFNPNEVVPEFTADVGIKKGEKVDYAIRHNGSVVILIECKKVDDILDARKESQLIRYFNASGARIGILTNGKKYQFYSDLEEKNKMDMRPFLELELDSIKAEAIEEVSKLCKDAFNLDQVLKDADSLKYISEIKKVIAAQIDKPDEDFVRFFFYKVAGSKDRFTASNKELFTTLVTKAFAQTIKERVNERLESALKKEEKSENEEPIEKPCEDESGIVTTEEEVEAYMIVRAICRRKVDLSRVFARDTKSYFGILLDDNNRKPICRLHFNSTNKYIGIFDAAKNETRHLLKTLTDIYGFEQQILETLISYEGQKSS